MKRYLITSDSRGIRRAIAVMLAAVDQVLTLHRRYTIDLAQEGFSQCVSDELRHRKIRVINGYPAATDTNIWTQIEGNWPRDKMIAPEEIASAVVFALSRPADVALENITLSSLAGNI